jgi:cell division protein FtsI (penicillin-binding protein 3)
VTSSQPPRRPASGRPVPRTRPSAATKPAVRAAAPRSAAKPVARKPAPKAAPKAAPHGKVSASQRKAASARKAPARAGQLRTATRPARRPVRRTRPLGRPGVRLRSGLVVLGAIVLLLGARLVQLQGIQPTAYAERGVQRSHTIPIAATRGEVLDRNGTPLALSVVAKRLYAEPKTIAKSICQPAATDPCDAGSIAAAMAPLLKVKAADLLARVGDTDRSFVYLTKGIDPALAQRVIDLGLPGIGQEGTSVRTHPSAGLAAAVLGLTNVDGKGISGIELALENVLAGTPGETVARLDSQGRVIPTGSDSHTDPVPGHDVELTIDQDLQWYAQSLIAQQVIDTRARNGTIVVEDTRTGEILALASAPTFNADHVMPNERTTLAGVSDVYEPGSVNKIITAAAALTAGVVTPDSVIDVPNSLPIPGGHVLHDAESHGLEHLTFAGVLAKSSNIGTVKVAKELGAQKLYDMMRSFGFGSKTGVGLPNESAGIIPTPAKWSGSSIYNIPIGQGISVSALQVASVYATVANAGVRVQPSIVRSTKDANGHVTPVAAAPKRRVITPEVASQIRDMLEGAVSEQGTAPKAAVPGYRVSGKTGTAQRVATDGLRVGHYDGTYTSSFVGMAPADNPRFVVAVVLQGTGAKGYFGGQVAAPLFSKVMGFALRSYGVAPTGTKPPVLRLTAD